MRVSSVGSPPVVPMLPERGEKNGPDVDQDTDDSHAKSEVQAAPAAGTGKLVDKTV